MHIFLEKWNVMSIVKPLYLINLIRLITFLGFQDHDIRSLTRDGRGLGGGGIYIVERLCMWKLHPEIQPLNPFKSIYHYTINSRSRSFYKPNRQNSLPFHILQLEKVSPLSDTTLLYKTALFR